MNILYISPSPVTNLHRVRSMDIVHYLTKYHKVHLLYLTDKPVKLAYDILRSCASVTFVEKTYIQSLASCLRLVFSPTPYEVAYCHCPQMEKAIAESIKNNRIDLVYVKRLRSLGFIENLSERIPTVVDTTDAMSLFYKRAFLSGDYLKKPLYFHEWITYRNYEIRAFGKIKHWITCSRLDGMYLKKLSGGKANIHVVPNGVDIKRFHPMRVREKPFTIALRGLMDKLVNIDAAIYFVKKILPLVRKEIPQVQLLIVGPNPSLSVRRLSDGVSIRVTGYIDNMAELTAQSSLVVCPIRIGTGTRYKILQSWAMSKPVVSTVLGAEGLRTKHMKNIMLAKAPEEFAHAVVYLLKNKRIAQQIGRSGKQTVDKYYDMSVVGKKLDQVLSRVVSQTI